MAGRNEGTIWPMRACRRYKLRSIVAVASVLFLLIYLQQSRIILKNKKEYTNPHTTKNTLRILNDNDDIIIHAANMSPEKPIMISVVDSDTLNFAHNWLCNVQDFSVYSQVVLLATEGIDENFYSMWPNIKVFSVRDRLIFTNNSRIKDVLVKSLMSTIVISILKKERSVLVFSTRSVWLQDVTTLINNLIRIDDSKDVITSIFSGQSKTYDFEYTHFKPRKRVIKLLGQYTTILENMLTRFKQPETYEIPDSENPENYFSQLLHGRFGRVKYSVLPVVQVADDSFYYDRNRTKPVYIKGGKMTHLHVVRAYSLEQREDIRDAMDLHGHWFIEEKNNYKCDYDKVVKAEKSVWNFK